MKNEKKEAVAVSTTSWFKKFKVAVAALAFVAAGVFGASAADVPAQPEADETAGWSYSAPAKYKKPGGHALRGFTGSWD